MSDQKCKDPEKPNNSFTWTYRNITSKYRWNHLFWSGVEPGTKLLDLNDISKIALRNRLSEVKLLIIDEFSMVSSDL